MPKLDYILLILLGLLLAYFAIQYIVKTKRNNQEIFIHLKQKRSKYIIENISVQFSYNLLSVNYKNCDIYFLTSQIILIEKKTYLFFPSYKITYSISNAERTLPNELFENRILNFTIETKGENLVIDGVFKTDTVLSQENEPVDGDIVVINIPLHLAKEKLESLLIDCKLKNGS